ncbi:LolA family protein [Alkalithermobacter paradoxus]|uniref:DUF4367 domain-containing protein n=1 Tax=Alkalithermobacter paradoxus TaxID=29349 RepID=A0A1V4I4R7_9FIRM|nr:hypothetical protein CLOTH_17740 [[Clostridium] thermoalcaliphilum]
MENNKEEIISSLIDDMNDGKNPKITDEMDEEMKEIISTIKLIKRFKSSKKVVELRRKRVNTTLKVASILIFFILSISILSPLLNKGNNDIVYAMSKAYEEVQSYFGIIEITSQRNGEIESREKITVSYKKPDMYHAVHEIENYTITQISDGEKLYSISGNNVTIEYTNPNKELWRYHIESTIRDMESAIDIQKIGNEKVAGREAHVYKFRYSKSEPFNKIYIDKKSNMPLRREINTNENVSVINTFVKLEINKQINDSLFTYNIKSDDVVTYLNKKITKEDVEKRIGNIDILLSQIPDNFTLNTIVELEDAHLYDYLFSLKGKNSDFVDIYLSLSPNNEINFGGEKIKLDDKYIYISEDVVNLFKVYIGKSNVLRYTDNNVDILAVTNLSKQKIIDIFQKINY